MPFYFKKVKVPCGNVKPGSEYRYGWPIKCYHEKGHKGDHGGHSPVKRFEELVWWNEDER